MTLQLCLASLTPLRLAMLLRVCCLVLFFDATECIIRDSSPTSQLTSTFLPLDVLLWEELAQAAVQVKQTDVERHCHEAVGSW